MGVTLCGLKTGLAVFGSNRDLVVEGHAPWRKIMLPIWKISQGFCLSTTGQYLASLGRADNPYADAIDAALGGEEG
jgi:hypothetical protein